LIGDLGLSDSPNTQIRYRGEGWPGKLEVKNQKVRKTESLNKYWGKYFGYGAFTPKHCMVCGDFYCTSADLVTGDAWLKEYMSDKKGLNVIAVYNQKANGILTELNLKLVRIEHAKFRQSQILVEAKKHRYLPLRRTVFLNSPGKKSVYSLLFNGIYCLYYYSSNKRKESYFLYKILNNLLLKKVLLKIQFYLLRKGAYLK